MLGRFRASCSAPGAGVIAPSTLAPPPPRAPLIAPHPAPVRASHPLLRLHNVAAGLSVVLVLLQLRGGGTGDLAALLTVPLVAACTFAAERRFLPALMILCLPALGILGGRDAVGVRAPFVFPGASTFVSLGGVEVTGPLVMLAAAFARVGVEVLTGARAFRGVVPRWLLLFFLVSMIPVLAGGLQGQALGYNRWSQGPRAMLAIAGFLWGLIVARRAGAAGMPRLGRQLCTLVIAAALLLVVGIMRGMLLFVVVGMIGGVLPAMISRRRILEAMLCGLAVMAAALSMTLTTLGEVVFALLCFAVAIPRFRGVGRVLLRLGVLSACVMSALMIWAVMQMQGKTLVEVATRDEGVIAYGVFKLMGDRGPLWLASVEQITSGPYVVVPSGRPLRPQGFDYGGLVYTWDFGAHNAVLELVRNVGLVGGAAGLALIGLALAAAVGLLLETRDVRLRGLAAGFLGVAIVGMTTGNFTVYDTGFILWAVGGMLAGARRYAVRPDAEDEPSAAAAAA